MKEHAEVGIGSVVWLFDANRRVYRPRHEGDKYGVGGPIYREHFRPLRVMSESRVSWILENGRKVPKRTLDGIYTTPAQIDDACFVHENACKIGALVNRCSDADTLRQIRALLGEPA